MKEYKSDTETLHTVIEQMEKDLINLKKQRGRMDKGKKRNDYISTLPLPYKRYIASANKRQIVFELTVDEFTSITSHPCVYCGGTNRIGVDRKDSSSGYTIDNVQPCCGICNLMKFTHDEETFLKHIHKVLKYRSLV